MSVYTEVLSVLAERNKKLYKAVLNNKVLLGNQFVNPVSKLGSVQLINARTGKSLGFIYFKVDRGKVVKSSVMIEAR